MLKPVPVRHYLNVIRSLGVGEAAVLDGTGIDAGMLGDSRCLVSLKHYRHLFENMAGLTEDRPLGLDIGLSTSMPDLGPLGYAAFSCRTARQSMEEFWSRYGEMLGIMGRPVIVSDTAELTTLELATPLLTESASRLCVEEALGLMMKIGHMVTRHRPVFESLEFAFAAPRYEARYRELFRCPIRFDRPATRAIVRRQWIEKTLPSNDAGLCDFYQRHLSMLQKRVEASASIACEVRDRLLRHSACRFPALASVAEEMGMSERTLSRRLQDEGLNYRQLAESVRREQAVRLMQQADMPAEKIGEELGFRDVNAFRRAFRKWTGKTVRRHKLETKNLQDPPKTAPCRPLR